MRVGSSGLMKSRVSEALRSISRIAGAPAISKGVGYLRPPGLRGARRPQESRQRFGCHFPFAGCLKRVLSLPKRVFEKIMDRPDWSGGT
jgi:hypothetical protein